MAATPHQVVMPATLATSPTGLATDKPFDETLEEPLLTPTPRRFVVFPITDPEVWDAYQRASDAFWPAKTINFADDQRHWESLDDKTRNFLLHTLAFFAASDGIVNENIAQRFSVEVQLSEARLFYAMQIGQEAIHSVVYSMLIDTYVKDAEQRNTLFNAIEKMPCIKLKADWALRWLSSTASFAERLVAFAVVEGVLFQSSFASIFYMKLQQLLPGLATANRYIARDEAEHARFACLLYRRLRRPLPVETVYDIVRSAMVVEDNFVSEALPIALIGMNAAEMRTYVRFMADVLLGQLGVPPLYNVANPFPFTETLGLDEKTNMFENPITSYQLAGFSKPGGAADDDF